MSDVSILTSHLGKSFRPGALTTRHATLRDSIAASCAAPWRLLRSAAAGTWRSGARRQMGETVWALRDVSFEINSGEVVGIIGRNGAGKSTLLKILSRITEPSEGFAEIRGRVGSLLEVGTGFHPELSGRENIFLNSAILGMGRAEIHRKFDEIVSFAEVEKFIDTPVKHYSSGMYLRLAFAVAAHLDPEILLVDEVLAVGDATFQKKCLGRMQCVAKEGRTVLFVSHNMGAVRSLCQRGILLQGGNVCQSGHIGDTIEAYYRAIGSFSTGESDESSLTRTGLGPVSLNNGSGMSIHQSDGFTASTTLQLNEDAAGFRLYRMLVDMHGHNLATIGVDHADSGLKEIVPGTYRVSATFPPLWLAPGLYSLSFKVFLQNAGNSHKLVSDAFPLDVEGESGVSQSVLHPKVEWSVESPVSANGRF